MRKFGTLKEIDEDQNGQTQLEFLVSIGLVILVLAGAATLLLELWGINQARLFCQSNLRKLILDSQYPTNLPAPIFCETLNHALKSEALRSLKIQMCYWNQNGHHIQIRGMLEGKLFRRVPFHCEYKKVYS